MSQLIKALKFALALALTGLALLGARSALAGTPRKLTVPTGQPAPAPQATAPEKARVIELTVTERGFEPSPVNVRKGEPLKLVVTRKTDDTCATKIVIDEAGIKKDLPLNQPVELTFTPAKSGELKYGCAMGKMVSGVLLVE